MDTWGSDTFENDGATDWLNNFCKAPAIERIVNALSTIAESDVFDQLDAPTCVVGIAAAEVVAALKGEWNPNWPDHSRQYVSKLTIKADADLVSSSLRAVGRIKTDSELKELWDQSENRDEWYSAVAKLEARLKVLDIGAIFDLALAEVFAEEVPATGSSLQNAKVQVESAASIEDAHMDAVYERLRELVPKTPETDEGTAQSAPEFDEDLYQQMKPLLTEIFNDIEKKAKRRS